MSEKEDPKARKAELLAAREKREAEREATRERLELEYLELEAKYEEELGPKGIAFAIVDVSDCSLEHPFIVLKLGEPLPYRKFKGLTDEQKMMAEHQQNFVAPACVVPTDTQFRVLSSTRPGVAERAAAELLGLYGQDIGKKRGK